MEDFEWLNKWERIFDEKEVIHFTENIKVLPCDITITTKEGFKAILQKNEDNWKCIVVNQHFHRFEHTFSASIKFAQGYMLDHLKEKSVSWQRQHIQLIFSNNNEPIVYVGKLGLNGGGPLNWFGNEKCTMFCCFNDVWRCKCGYKCCDDSCWKHCRFHYQSHTCKKCFSKKCPIYYKCQTCYSSKYCSSCCGCYEKQQEQIRQEEIRQERIKQEQLREEQIKKERIRQEEIKQQQKRDEQIRQEKRRQEHKRQEQIRKQQIKQEEEIRKEQIRQKQIRQEQIRQEQIRQEQIWQAQIRQEEIREKKIKQKQIRQEQELERQNAISKINECLVSLRNFNNEGEEFANKIEGKDDNLQCTQQRESNIFINNQDAATNIVAVPYASENQNYNDEIIEHSISNTNKRIDFPSFKTGVDFFNDFSFKSKPTELSQILSVSNLMGLVSFDETVDSFDLQKITKLWSNITKIYNKNELEKLLHALKRIKILHSLSLSQISDLLEITLETGSEGYKILSSKEEDWLYDFEMKWIDFNVKMLPHSFTEEEQNKLSYAIADLPWTTLMTRLFFRAIKDEKTVYPIIDFLSVVRENEVPNSVVLKIIVMKNTVGPQYSKCKQWTKAMNYHLTYININQLSPDLASLIYVSLLNILQSTCSADLLVRTVYDNIDLLNQHSQDFKKVLDQLYNYQTTENICEEIFQILPNVRVKDWSSKIDQLIVDRIFQGSHTNTIQELIDYIAIRSPNISFVESYNLTKHYQSILNSYNAPSTTLNLKRGNRNSSINFEYFASNHSTIRLSMSDIKKLKSQPICKWNKKEVQLWSEYIKPSEMEKLCDPVPQSELIAIVKRAVELQNNYSPRATQLLSVLTLLNANNTGRLAQINTGEGKSLIVAMLSACHALQGKQVDVITTSTELSIPEVKIQQPFFQLLSLTVGENSQNSSKPLVYKNDILYGISGDFQADILRTEFLGDDCRSERKFQIVIVDEVDCMLFDNRSHSVRLSEQSPGMNHLELPLGVIWDYLQRLAQRFINHEGNIFFISEDFETIDEKIELLSGEPWESCATHVTDKRSFLTEKTQNHLKNLLRDLNEEEKNEYQAHQEISLQIQTLSAELTNTTDSKQKEEITSKCKNLSDMLITLDWSKRYPVIEVPIHLRSFARSQIPNWIKNALNAAYAYRKDAHYAVIKDKIVPIHYNETGVLQSNMVWNNGLTQFLQIKEGLGIDPEGVATNSISNVNFFKRYGNSIYGLTGTLGDESTRTFLQEMYGLDFLVIPPYMQQIISNNEHTPYLCKELTPIVIEDKTKWHDSIVEQALYHAVNKRAILVICKYIDQVNYLYEILNKQYQKEKIFCYTGQETLFAKSDIDSGEIIIATNIAGRGTDFKTSKEVEKHGGLYVAVTFLPESCRVELQNVGRTAREGKKGMAQLIVHNTMNTNMLEMKRIRNEQEANATSNAIRDAKNVLVQDELFHKFCNVENRILPTINECEKIQHWKRLTINWDYYAADKLSLKKIEEKFNHWMNETIQKIKTTTLASLSLTERNRLTDTDLQGLDEKIFLLTKSELPAFEVRYKKKVLNSFCASYSDDIPKELLECLLNGNVFEPNYTKLAKKYNWGENERKGIEEIWGLWLKEYVEGCKTDIDKETAIRDFEKDFVYSLKDDAKEDKLIRNPYFYILKGNTYRDSMDLSCAIACYDRAISMDPIYSVNARYNKAQALLLYKSNSGLRQELAYQELKKAKDIIDGIYRPSLLTFNTIISQNGQKLKTSQHVQHQLNVLSEQENYILKVCDVIKSAQSKGYDVKLTSKTLIETFRTSEENHDKAIREAAVNGFTNLFTIEEKTPIPWSSIAYIALIGISQIAFGCLIVACTGGALGVGLITEGVSDLIVSVQSAISGSFSWAAWAARKVISLAISIFSAGYSSLKSGVQCIANTAKDLVGKTAVGTAKKGIELAIKETCAALGKGIIKECLMEAGKHCTNKLFMEKLEKKIRESVEKALNTAFLNNPTVVNLLIEDQKNGNTNNQQQLIDDGLSLLKEKKEHQCFTILREIGIGVAKNKIPLCSEILQTVGVVKMLCQLNNYTDNFIAQFNDKILIYEEDIVVERESATIKRSIQETTSTSQRTVISASPIVNLEEGDVSVHTLKKGTTYKSKIDAKETKLKSKYNNLGPSTPSKLADNFSDLIVDKLLGSIKNSLVTPILNYSTNAFTTALFKESDTSRAALRKNIKTERECRSESNALANKCKVNHTKSSNNEENDCKNIPPKKEEKLNTSSQEAIIRLKNKEVKDGTDLGLMSAVAEVPIYVVDEKGNLKYVVGDNQTANPIFIKHIAPTPENPTGHFEPVNKNIYVKPSGLNTCAVDAVYAQLSEEKKNEVKDINGFTERMINVIENNPKKANAAYKKRDELLILAQDRIISGGAKKRKPIRVDSDSSTMDLAMGDQFQNHHIIHRRLKEHAAVLKSGMNINDIKNLISLPTKKGKSELETSRSVHIGRHPKKVVYKIIEKLDAIDKEGIDKNWNEAQYKQATSNYIKEYRRKLRKGEETLY